MAIRVLGVRRRLGAPLVPRSDAVVTYQPLDLRQADAVTAALELAVHAPRAVGALDFGVDRFHQGHGLRITQAARVRGAATAPRAIAAGAHAQHLAHVRLRVEKAQPRLT